METKKINFELKHFTNPIHVSIENTSDVDIENIDIGDSYFNRSQINYGNNPKIKIESLIPNFSYKRMLAHSEGFPDKIVNISLASSEKENLNDNKIVSCNRDPKGRKIEITDVIFTDENKIVLEQEFTLNGLGRVRIGKIKANSKIELILEKEKVTSFFYDIQIKNNGNEDVNNVILGWAYENRSIKNYGNEVNITIKSLIDDTSYNEFLAQAETQPIKVKSTLFTFSSEKQKSIPIKIKDGINEYQFKSTNNDLKDDGYEDSFNYEFNGDVRFEIEKLLAGEEIIVRLYL